MSQSFATVANAFVACHSLAIEGRVEWSAVEAIAQQVFDHGQGEASREVAKVNFYQVARHQGKTLSDTAVADIRQLLDNNRNSPAFVMCCHLLLGTATQEMVQRCVADYQSEDVLQWPIIKLANPRILGF